MVLNPLPTTLPAVQLHTCIAQLPHSYPIATYIATYEASVNITSLGVDFRTWLKVCRLPAASQYQALNFIPLLHHAIYRHFGEAALNQILAALGWVQAALLVQIYDDYIRTLFPGAYFFIFLSSHLEREKSTAIAILRLYRGDY